MMGVGVNLGFRVTMTISHIVVEKVFRFFLLK